MWIEPTKGLFLALNLLIPSGATTVLATGRQKASGRSTSECWSGNATFSHLGEVRSELGVTT